MCSFCCVAICAVSNPPYIVGIGPRFVEDMNFCPVKAQCEASSNKTMDKFICCPPLIVSIDATLVDANL